MKVNVVVGKEVVIIRLGKKGYLVIFMVWSMFLYFLCLDSFREWFYFCFDSLWLWINVFDVDVL